MIKVITILIYTLITKLNNQECPKNEPIYTSDDRCQNKYCNENDFQNGDCTINNSIIKIQWLNKLIFLGENYFRINSLKMPNNDIFIILYNYNEREKIYIYGLKSSGEVYFNDNEENIREINALIDTSYINSAGLIINNKQYIFICITNYELSESNCQIIDYETNNNYNENLYKLLKYDNRDDFHKAGRMFTILNLNQQNKILLSYLEENSIDFSIINLSEEDFSSYDIIKNSKRNDILLNSLRSKDLNCFITEKKFIECFILHPSGTDEGDLLIVEIFDESLNHLDYIFLDN